LISFVFFRKFGRENKNFLVTVEHYFLPLLDGMYFGFGIENVYFGTTFVQAKIVKISTKLCTLVPVVLLGEYKIYFSLSVVRREVEGRFVTLHLDSLLQKSIPFRT
jgi:hypothetical protein